VTPDAEIGNPLSLLPVQEMRESRSTLFQLARGPVDREGTSCLPHGKVCDPVLSVEASTRGHAEEQMGQPWC
jgi:hypothetical protein